MKFFGRRERGLPGRHGNSFTADEREHHFSPHRDGPLFVALVPDFGPVHRDEAGPYVDAPEGPGEVVHELVGGGNGNKTLHDGTELAQVAQQVGLLLPLDDSKHLGQQHACLLERGPETAHAFRRPRSRDQLLLHDEQQRLPVRDIRPLRDLLDQRFVEGPHEALFPGKGHECGENLARRFPGERELVAGQALQACLDDLSDVEGDGGVSGEGRQALQIEDRPGQAAAGRAQHDMRGQDDDRGDIAALDESAGECSGGPALVVQRLVDRREGRNCVRGGGDVVESHDRDLAGDCVSMLTQDLYRRDGHLVVRREEGLEVGPPLVLQIRFEGRPGPVAVKSPLMTSPGSSSRPCCRTACR